MAVLPCSLLAFYIAGIIMHLMVLPFTNDASDMLKSMTMPFMAHWMKMAHVRNQQTGTCPCSPVAKTRARSRTGKDAVVVLATRARMNFLNETLRLFYRNFNRCMRKDVLIFHNGDFTQQDMVQLRSELGPEIKFHELAPGTKWWGPPDSIKDQIHRVDTGHWPIGFFHMTRWFGVLVYEYLHGLGYEWFMRMDDDSYFLSCIPYDMFWWADNNNITYAYRMIHIDDGTGPFTDIIQNAMDEWGQPITPKLLKHFEGGVFTHEKWDGHHYYNNFCLTKLAFWMSPAVRYLLTTLDDAGYQYTRRVLDAPLQSMIVDLLIPEKNIWHFTDWSYSHHPKLAVSPYALLPTELANFLQWLGLPQFDLTFGLHKGKDIRFFLDVQKVFGKGSKWYRALRR